MNMTIIIGIIICILGLAYIDSNNKWNDMINH